MLALLGVGSEEASSGLEALAALRVAAEEGKGYDLVFLDLTMPGIDGFEAVRRMREAGLGGTVYALSGVDEGPEIGAAGFDGFIQKPITMEGLRAAVAAAQAAAAARGGAQDTDRGGAQEADQGGAHEAGQGAAREAGVFPAGTWAEAGSLFRFCPSCGSRRLVSDRGRRWVCPDCGFEYFHNVASAAGVIIETKGGVLLLARAKEPQKGRLCLPGGFVEPGERAEDAALRECREELGWAPERIEFLASYPNLYRYKGVPYATCDLYVTSSSPGPRPQDLDLDPGEAEGLRYAGVEGFPWAEIAFDSARRALRRYFARA
jgi:ADP-ribose pyrophosphatase YjhB (NUDIX family)/CheY-like chemotaxis protein